MPRYYMNGNTHEVHREDCDRIEQMTHDPIYVGRHRALFLAVERADRELEKMAQRRRMPSYKPADPCGTCTDRET